MTEEKLETKQGKAAKRRIAGLFLASFGILALALWLFRQPIAEAIARGVCSDQGLSCKLSVTRLDFGGVTLTDVDARAPAATAAAISAREIVIDLAWDGPFAVRPVAVAGDAITLRLDLTGRRPVFGDLEQAIANFTKPSDQPPGPTPRVQVSNLTVIGETLSGPVTATGRVVAEDASAFTVEMQAQPASLGVAGGTMDLSAANLNARIAGDDISAVLKLDLARFAAEGASLSDVVVDATLEQSSGALKGQGTASLGAIATKDGKLSSAKAEAVIDSPAIGGEAFNIIEWLGSVRRLEIDASTGEGAYAGIAWNNAKLAFKLLQENGAPKGDIAFTAERLNTPQAAAGRVDVDGQIEIRDAATLVVSGVATTQAGMFSAPQRAALASAAADPLESVVPTFAASLRNAIDRAGRSFAVRTPWSARLAPNTFTVSLHSGAEFVADSGLVLKLAARDESDVVGAFNLNTYEWTGAGNLSLQGGGAPTLAIDVAKAAGGLESLSLSGAASLKSWRVDDDAVSAEFSDLDLAMKGPAGAAAGRLDIKVDGSLAGGEWRNARATGQVSATWDRDTFAAEAPQGAVIQWDRAAYGGAQFGAAALRYTPTGQLAQRAGEGLAGRGRLEAISLPVTGEGFAADVSLGATAINWRTANGFRASFDATPAAVTLKLDDRTVPIRIADIVGNIDLSRGWKVDGKFNGASAETAEGNVADLSGSFDLAGRGENLSGSLTGLAMRLVDPLDEGKRYEPINFRGEAHLNNSLADFTGTFTMVASGMQVAHVVGRHDLDTGAGALTFEPTPLIFRPRQFQPSDLSPMLIGPANVTGRLDVAGNASWTPDAGFKASGVLDLKKLGFALAAAGVFEGVSGHIEVDDLLNMRSDPGQRITIDKVTLGLPIENGTIDFQLIGYDSIQLESARWPFAGGFLRVDAMRFLFSSAAQNRIVARAENWDLAVLADQLKIPDTKLAGVVGGEFPVVFRTGSAEIDNAVLKSVRPGVIQYSGSTGDAAAQADDNSKMLFDALKDFRYEVLEVGLDGNLTGRMMVTLGVLGRNPDVLGGQPFQLNIGIDSALVPLLTTTFQRPDIKTAIEQTQGGQQ